jgi:integrase
MHKSIKDLIDGVLHEIEVHGLTQSTITQYRLGFYRPIIKYFTEKNNGYYSLDVLESCKNNYEEAFKTQKIKQHHLSSMKRSLNYLREFAETDKVSFKPNVNTRVYVPSENAHKLIESALETTNLKENFKYRLHVIMRRFFCFIEAQNIITNDISADTIKEFICLVSVSNSGSMEYVVYSLKILLNYLRSVDAINFKFDLNYFVPKSRAKRIIAAFSEEEISKILTSIDTNTSIGKRNYSIILLACGTGFRGIDIVKLKFSDINWKLGEISIVQSKTGRPVKLPINGQIRNALADYILNGRPKSNFANIFLRENAPFICLKGTATLDKVIESACTNAGVTKKPYRSFHSLRRSFGSWMAKEGVPITTIAQMLGHADMDSSKPYLSFDDSQMISCTMGFEDIPLKGDIYA